MAKVTIQLEDKTVEFDLNGEYNSVEEALEAAIEAELEAKAMGMSVHGL